MSGRETNYRDRLTEGQRIQHLTRAAGDIAQDYLNLDGQEFQDAFVSYVSGHDPAVVEHYEAILVELVKSRVSGEGRQQDVFREARRALPWINKTSKQVNPEVLAEAALEIGLTYMRGHHLLFYNPDALEARPEYIRFGWDGSLGAALPPPGEEVGGEFRLTRHITDAVVAGTDGWGVFKVAGKTHSVPRFPLKSSPPYAVALDPIRPPFEALRMAAAIVEQHSSVRPLVRDQCFGLRDFDIDAPRGEVRGRVLGVDLGIVAGPWCLGSFLPEVEVHTRDVETGGAFNAVVVNIPGPQEANYVATVRDRLERGVPLSSREVNRRTAQADDDCGVTDDTVSGAIGQLDTGGVLVVMGDTASGSVHIARRVAREAGLVPIELTNEGDYMVQYTYTERPWTCFDVPPPTGRILAAWKRG